MTHLVPALCNHSAVSAHNEMNGDDKIHMFYQGIYNNLVNTDSVNQYIIETLLAFSDDSYSLGLCLCT